jgi:hypothetical protein
MVLLFVTNVIYDYIKYKNTGQLLFIAEKEER